VVRGGMSTAIVPEGPALVYSATPRGANRENRGKCSMYACLLFLAAHNPLWCEEIVTLCSAADNRSEIQGQWDLVILCRCSNDPTTEAIRWEFNGDTVLLSYRGQEHNRGKFTLSYDKYPHEINIVFDKTHARALGIFRLHGDRLEIAVSEHGPRPTDFSSKTDCRPVVLLFRRPR